jgi:hypothetical protein
MSEQPQTWHYGPMAEWWAHFNTDGGDELAYVQPFVEAGQPALDAGCGNGRLLLPCCAQASTSTAATSPRT